MDGREWVQKSPKCVHIVIEWHTVILARGAVFLRIGAGLNFDSNVLPFWKTDSETKGPYFFKLELG